MWNEHSLPNALKPGGFFFFFVLMLIASPAGRAGERPGNGSCLRCHGSSTLSVRDDSTGAIRSFFVDGHRFLHSNHRNLVCVDCHTTGFEGYPHALGASASSLQCTSCHKEDAKFAALRFPEIEKEFRSSVHVKKLGSRMRCFSCHDPHQFERKPDPTLTKIQQDNRTCMHCHRSEARFASLTGRSFPDLEVTHGWLPNAAMHWEKVRCVDCHSSYAAPNLSHNILPKSEAIRACEECHSRESVLMAKLYKHRAREERRRGGFVNSTLMNNAYVVGSTRNAFLDGISIGVFGLLFSGIGLHAWLRRQGRKRRTRT